jgi:hypothetical protein
VNSVDKNRMSPLFYAAKNGHLDVVAQLLKSKWLVESPMDLGVAEAAQQVIYNEQSWSIIYKSDREFWAFCLKTPKKVVSFSE